ncbi:MAG: alpha/beta hydrolase [Actinomycetota bacterium]
MALTVDVVTRCALDEVDSAGWSLRADADSIHRVSAGLPCLAADWAGVAGDAASARVGELRLAAQAIADFVVACAQVLSIAVTGLRPARDALDRAGRSAADLGLGMDQDGSVLLPPVAPVAAPPGDCGLAAFELERARFAAAAGALAHAALAEAGEVDFIAAAALRRFVAALRICTPVERSAALAFAVVGGSPLPLVPRSFSNPLDVAAWWSVLPAAARLLLLERQPDQLGNLDGMPAEVRHAANSSVLARELAAADIVLAREQSPDGLPRGAAVAASRRRAMLLAVRRQLATDPAARLLTLDFADGGLAAVALGDVDVTTDVAVVVPGLNQDVTGDLPALVADARSLRDTARALERDAALSGDIATVAWIGYRTPNLLTVASSHRAQVGGLRLASFSSGLDASREIHRMLQAASMPALHLSLVGHSYGSLAVGYAMQKAPPVDDLVLLGSPGVGVDSALQLTGRKDNVFVGEARGDPVADLGWFGRDPSSTGFGARQLQTDGGQDPLTGVPLAASYGHSDYLTAGSESLRNIAAVTIDAPRLATYSD